MVKVGFSRLVNAGPVAGHPAWIPVSWTFPHPLPPCVRVSDYLLLQSLHTSLDQASPAPRNPLPTDHAWAAACLSPAACARSYTWAALQDERRRGYYLPQ